MPPNEALAGGGEGVFYLFNERLNSCTSPTHGSHFHAGDVEDSTSAICCGVGWEEKESLDCGGSGLLLDRGIRFRLTIISCTYMDSQTVSTAVHTHL